MDDRLYSSGKNCSAELIEGMHSNDVDTRHSNLPREHKHIPECRADRSSDISVLNEIFIGYSSDYSARILAVARNMSESRSTPTTFSPSKTGNTVTLFLYINLRAFINSASAFI